MELYPMVLAGRKGLVVGIANENSIAYGCGRVFRDVGAELALTWLNDKAKPHVEPSARELSAALAMPLDVEQPGQMEAVFAAIREQWGRVDFVLHSIAYAPSADLHGRVTDSSREGFARAMDISCHSFLRMARLAEPLMGSGRLADHHELPRRRRGRSALRGDGTGESGVGSERSLPCYRARPPRHPGQRRVAGSDLDAGTLCAFLVCDGARGITGDTYYVDGGLHIMA